MACAANSTQPACQLPVLLLLALTAPGLQGRVAQYQAVPTCSLMKPAASFWSYAPPSSSKEEILLSYSEKGLLRPATITLPCRGNKRKEEWKALEAAR